MNSKGGEKSFAELVEALVTKDHPNEPRRMKLFYFNPNNYGVEAIVMAEDVEDAKAKLLATKHVPDNLSGTLNYSQRAHNDQIDEMVAAPVGPLPNDKYGNTIGEGYTIDEMSNGIVFTERS